jgi:D-tyrosyl-tRNA(Tyr) deacylase
MRAVIQRVKSASVSIVGSATVSVGKGLLVFVGIETDDTKDDIAWLSAKIVKMRIFSDTAGLMNLSVQETGGDILVVSQFTLHASTRKGNRPSFIRAARPEIAIPLYEQFVQQLETESGKRIKTGSFGADMEVRLVNDGPVTIMIDTKNKE